MDHHHGHSHPDSSPVVSTERTKQVDSPVILDMTAQVVSSSATLHWRIDTAASRVSRLALTLSGPRAPPIS
jgi:hypothetical protein